MRFHQANIKLDSLNILPPIVSLYLFKLLIFNCKFKIITVTQIYFKITSQISFWHAIATLTYPRFIKCATLFTSQLSKNYNYIHLDSILLSISDESTIPKKSLLCLPPLKHYLAPLRTSLSLLKSPTFLTHIFHFCQNITLTTHSKRFFLDLINDLRNII